MNYDIDFMDYAADEWEICQEFYSIIDIECDD